MKCGRQLQTVGNLVKRKMMFCAEFLEFKNRNQMFPWSRTNTPPLSSIKTDELTHGRKGEPT